MFGRTDVITALGRRGSGKTSLSRWIQTVYPRVVIFDRLNEYPEEHGPGKWTVRTFDEFCEAVKGSHGLKRFKILFQFDIEEDNHSAVFDEAMRVIYYRGDLCVVVEEVHHFATAHHLPKWLKEVLLTGRHRALALIATSQRPAEVHKTLLSQCHHIFCGTLNEANDVKYLASVMGSAARRVAALKPFQFVHFRPGEPVSIIKSRKI